MAKVDRNQEALKIAMTGLVTPVSPWRWVVVGSNNQKYSVCMMGENHYNCQCIDHKKNRHNCKHIKAVIALKAIGA